MRNVIAFVFGLLLSLLIIPLQAAECPLTNVGYGYKKADGLCYMFDGVNEFKIDMNFICPGGTTRVDGNCQYFGQDLVGYWANVYPNGNPEMKVYPMAWRAIGNYAFDLSRFLALHNVVVSDTQIFLDTYEQHKMQGDTTMPPSMPFMINWGSVVIPNGFSLMNDFALSKGLNPMPGFQKPQIFDIPQGYAIGGITTLGLICVFLIVPKIFKWGGKQTLDVLGARGSVNYGSTFEPDYKAISLSSWDKTEELVGRFNK